MYGKIISKSYQDLSFVLFLVFQTGFLCVGLAVLELDLQTSLTQNSQRFDCLCLLSAGIKRHILPCLAEFCFSVLYFRLPNYDFHLILCLVISLVFQNYRLFIKNISDASHKGHFFFSACFLYGFLEFLPLLFLLPVISAKFLK